MKIKKVKDLKVSKWSGGTTTELLIYPEESVYSERNFLFRISSAVIEDEHSVFTSLEAYERILMVLEGALKLEHETGNGIVRKELEQYAQTTFSGRWKTESHGKITDFNVIFNPLLNASVQIVSGESFSVGKNEYVFIWSIEGDLSFEKKVIPEGSFVYGISKAKSELKTHGKACLVRIEGDFLQRV